MGIERNIFINFNFDLFVICDEFFIRMRYNNFSVVMFFKRDFSYCGVFFDRESDIFCGLFFIIFE